MILPLLLVLLAHLVFNGYLVFKCLYFSQSSKFFFFFQAEDGIRDWSVTGVQTCALPISTLEVEAPAHDDQLHRVGDVAGHIVVGQLAVDGKPPQQLDVEPDPPVDSDRDRKSVV